MSIMLRQATQRVGLNKYLQLNETAHHCTHIIWFFLTKPYPTGKSRLWVVSEKSQIIRCSCGKVSFGFFLTYTFRYPRTNFYSRHHNMPTVVKSAVADPVWKYEGGYHRMEQRDMEVRQWVFRMLCGLEKELKDSEIQIDYAAGICQLIL